MTRNEFISLLKATLKDKHISDYEEIVEEYEQHFAFKLRDGYSEEEIAAKLGNPVLIAEQFDRTDTVPAGKRKIPTLIGLGVLDFFVGIFYIVLACFGIAIVAASVALTAISVCLFGGLNIYSLIPDMPYHCAILFAVTFIALAVIACAAFVYYVALLKQLYRAYKRFHGNTVATVTGTAVLPAISATPQLTPRTYRIFRKVLTVAFLLFVLFFVLSFAVAVISAGSIEFWHSWEWFGNAA